MRVRCMECLDLHHRRRKCRCRGVVCAYCCDCGAERGIVSTVRFAARSLGRLIKRAWYATPLHRHTWFVQDTHGTGFNVKTMKPVSFRESFEVCLYCKKRRPRT